MPLILGTPLDAAAPGCAPNHLHPQPLGPSLLPAGFSSRSGPVPSSPSSSSSSRREPRPQQRRPGHIACGCCARLGQEEVRGSRSAPRRRGVRCGRAGEPRLLPVPPARFGAVGTEGAVGCPLCPHCGHFILPQHPFHAHSRDASIASQFWGDFPGDAAQWLTGPSCNCHPSASAATQPLPHKNSLWSLLGPARSFGNLSRTSLCCWNCFRWCCSPMPGTLETGRPEERCLFGVLFGSRNFTAGYVSVGSGCALGAGRCLGTGRDLEPGLSSRGAGARWKSSPEPAAEHLPCARALRALHSAPALAAPARWLPSPQQQPQASPRLPRSQHRWKSSCRSSRMKQ